jgi:hypothetical protein
MKCYEHGGNQIQRFAESQKLYELCVVLTRHMSKHHFPYPSVLFQPRPLAHPPLISQHASKRDAL